MLRKFAFLLVLPLVLGASTAAAQAKKGAVKMPSDKDRSVAITVFMRDPATKNELLLATRVWPDYPDYNAVALGRFFQLMKMLEPPYKQDDDVAYSWQQKGGKITKCSIYLESADAGAKSGTGAVVGCEANGVSSVAVQDTKGGVSSSQDPKHLTEVLEMFKKQQERAKTSAGAK
ncbi:MAG: hypothetical protein U1F48_05750 [Burkholderiales bacterium]